MSARIVVPAPPHGAATQLQQRRHIKPEPINQANSQTKFQSSIGYQVATVGFHNQLWLVKESFLQILLESGISTVITVLHHVITLSTMASMALCIHYSRSLASATRWLLTLAPTHGLLFQEEARSTLEATATTLEREPCAAEQGNLLYLVSSM
jgi:membrane protein required for beta-lactamase induction